MAKFSITNFLSIPKGKDKFIRIYNKHNELQYSIRPENTSFNYFNNKVYINQDESKIILDFINEDEASKAISMLNKIKSKLVKISKDFYTTDELDNGVLDYRYPTSDYIEDNFVNITGDTMTGDLRIVTLSGNTITNMNINEVGELIKGNQHLIRKTIDSNNFVDSFKKTLDYSVFWEYSVKNSNNIRAGTIIGVWDENNNKISYSHHSTIDLGDTSDIEFTVGMDSNNEYIRLLATCTYTWKIKVLRRFI